MACNATNNRTPRLLDADRRAALYDRIIALPAQSLLTGTGAELFTAFGPRARLLSVTKNDNLSTADEVA